MLNICNSYIVYITTNITLQIDFILRPIVATKTKTKKKMFSRYKNNNDNNEIKKAHI